MAGAKKETNKSGKSAAKSKKGKSTESEGLALDDLSGVSGGMARKVTKATECTTGLLSTCKVEETKIDSWCPC